MIHWTELFEMAFRCCFFPSSKSKVMNLAFESLICLSMTPVQVYHLLPEGWTTVHGPWQADRRGTLTPHHILIVEKKIWLYILVIDSKCYISKDTSHLSFRALHHEICCRDEELHILNWLCKCLLIWSWCKMFHNEELSFVNSRASVSPAGSRTAGVHSHQDEDRWTLHSKIQIQSILQQVTNSTLCQ